MVDVLSVLLDISVTTFAIASMLSVGLSYTVKEILGPIRNFRAVLRVLVANFVLVPLLGYLILQIIPLRLPYAIGLFLLSSAAGAPFLIKLTQVARQSVAISASLLVILIPATIVYLPIVVPLALPQAEISATEIAIPLVQTMLLPLIIGLFIRYSIWNLAVRVQPYISQLSSIAMALLVLSTIIIHFNAIIGFFGTGAILAALILIIGAFLIGYLAGGPSRDSQYELALATAQRNIAAVTVVATSAVGSGSSDALIMVVVSSLVGLAAMFPVAIWIRKHDREKTRIRAIAESVDGS